MSDLQVANPSLRRIAVVSRVLRDLCRLALLLFAVTMILLWTQGSLHIGSLHAEFANEPLPEALGRPLALLAHLPSMISVAFALLSAARLFECFRLGEIFSTASVRHLSQFAWSALAATLTGLAIVPLGVGLAALAEVTPLTPLPLLIEGQDLAALLLSTMLVVLSWVLRQAKQAADELELII